MKGRLLKKKNIDLFAFILVIVLNGIIVLSGITNRSLFMDELFSLGLADSSLDELMNVTMNDCHPPFYYILLNGWVKIFGTSEFSVRFPSYMFGVGCLILIFYWIRKNINKKTAVLSSLLIAITPLVIRYQQEARMYTLLPFLFISLFLLLEYWINNNFPNKHSIYIIIIATLLLYTHNYGLIGIVLIFFIFMIRIIIFRRNISNKAFLIHFIPIGLVLIIIYLPWLPIVYNQSQKFNFWYQKVGEITFNDFWYHSLSSIPVYISSFQKFLFLFFSLMLFLGLIIMFSDFLIRKLSIIKKKKNNIDRENNTTSVKSKFERENIVISLVIGFIYFGVPFFISATEFLLGYSIYAPKFMLFSVILFKIVISYCLVTVIPQFINRVYNFLRYEFKKNRLFQSSLKPQLITEAFIFIFIIGIIPYSTISYLKYSNPLTDKYFHTLHPDWPYSDRFYWSNPDYRGAASFIEQNSAYVIPVITDWTVVGGFQYYLDDPWQSHLHWIPTSPLNETQIINDIYDIVNYHFASSFWFSVFWAPDGDNYVYNYFNGLGLADTTIGIRWFEGGLRLIRVNL